MKERIKHWREKMKQKKHKRFINRIVNNTIMNSEKTYEQSRGKAVRLTYKKEEWKEIRSNLQEINDILLRKNVRRIIYD